MYRANAERERYREQAFSLKDYVEGLQLRVDVADMTDDDLARVAQLTFRTNQFNFTTRRRSEGEIRRFLGRDDAHGLVVRVTDRFGDYGLVGVVLYEVAAGRCSVDTLLVSCRVLGRGVEHAVVAALAERALAQGCRLVDIAFVRTERNAPALEFVASIGEGDRNGEAASWAFPAEALAHLRYVPVTAVAPASPRGPAARRAALAFDFADASPRLQHIADHLRDIGQVAAAIDEHRMSRQRLHAAPEEATSSKLEAALRDIWRSVLGMPRIGLDDNFFDVGGTSLRAVQVLSSIKQQLSQSLSIVSLFECPTVRSLAARMGGNPTVDVAAHAMTAAAQRGQNRRYHPTRPPAH
jgi:hypothetical protein